MSGSLFVKDTFSPVAARARRLSGEARVSVDSVALALHSYDAGLARFRPEAVISVAEASGLAPLMRLLAENGVPVTPRGLGSSLTGGCAPAKGGAVLKLGGLNKILEIDTAAGYAFVEAGVCNGVLQDELSRADFFYSPLPLSFRCSTVGGNIAVNARGPRSLKYGSAADNLLAVDIVSPGGDEFRLERGRGGPDMAGFFSGLEGTCGVAARVKVRITRRSGTLIYFLAAFNSPEELLLAAAQAQSQGVCFRSLEALDKMSATASESCFGDGYPLDCGALAVGELDGHGAADDLKTLKRVFKAAGCPWFKADECDPKSEPVWLASSRAFSAVARLSHSVLSEDFSVPRKKLGLAIGAASAALAQYDLRAGMVYSPCTGSLRPSILFDERNIFETRRARKAAHEMLKACAEMGGAVAGRFGAGVEKRMALPLQYSDSELGLLRAIKEASDPADLCNPEKILPVSTARSHKKGQQALPRPVLDLLSELQCRVQNSTASFICGSGSRLHGRQAGEKLSTLGLDAVLETDLDGGYITVGAGMKLSALAEEFSRLGLKAPFHSRKGTLGGLLATGQWLPPEGLLVSLSVALADGSTAQFGALSLEPGSGSGAGRLFLGSWGSYGVLLSATFALYCPVASPAREQEKPEFRAPSSGPELKFKKVFDPLGLLNPGLSQEGA